MNRREALRRVTLLIGAVSIPTATSVLSGCQVDGSEAWTPQVLTGRQNNLVIVVSEHIIPETDTPGARATGVNRFIDTLLSESYVPEQRERFLSGLNEMENRCSEAYGRRFLECEADEQIAFLSQLDEEAFGEEANFDPGNPPFFRTVKELTLIGYYTSEVGGSQELKINIVPGRYDGCVPYEEIGRAWSAEV